MLVEEFCFLALRRFRHVSWRLSEKREFRRLLEDTALVHCPREQVRGGSTLFGEWKVDYRYSCIFAICSPILSGLELTGFVLGETRL